MVWSDCSAGRPGWATGTNGRKGGCLMASKTIVAIVATEADQAAARDVVFNLLAYTSCLAEVRGADIGKLVLGIAAGFARERDRVEAERAPVTDGPPLPSYHELLDTLCKRFGIIGSPTFNEAMDRIAERRAGGISEAESTMSGSTRHRTHLDLLCRGCKEPLVPENSRVADGCPCNSGRGINHGLVPSRVCTCDECDPEKTGSSRAR